MITARVCIIGLLFATACGDDGSAAGDDLCDRLPDSGFVSEQPAGAVMLEDGPQPSADELDFSPDEVWWWTGDTVETGGWTCDINEVVWLDGSFDGELTEHDGRLVITEPDGFRWIGPETDSE